MYVYQCEFFARRNAQVAVLDTYTGEAKAALLLANSTGGNNRLFLLWVPIKGLHS